MEEETGFKVTDRRRRSEEEDRAPQAPEAVPAPPPPAASPVGDAAADVLDLRTVFMMFGSSALMGLGEAADPVTGERQVDLDQAHEAIEVLMLLRDKTEGNRSAEESAFLEDLLDDLHVRFVRLSQPESG
jgi:hypothetical protein